MIDRRSFLTKMSLLVGGTLSAPSLAFLAGEGGGTAHAAAAPLFTKAQRALVETVTELILPATDTPGARAAGVPDFVEMMVADWYATEEREAFLAGLARLDALALEAGAPDFVSLDAAQELAILQRLEGETISGGSGAFGAAVVAYMAKKPQPHFILAMKEMTLVGFFTSKVGADLAGGFEIIPGRHDGCIPIAASVS